MGCSASGRICDKTCFVSSSAAKEEEGEEGRNKDEADSKDEKKEKKKDLFAETTEEEGSGRGDEDDERP